MDSDFVCPKCKISLVTQSGGYYCERCKHFYPSRDGYVDFLGDIEFYAGEETQQDMQRLLNDIDSLGFDEGLSRLVESYPYLGNYISDVRRADWISHCIGENNIRCLDIGSGLGNLSERLSHTYEEIYSLEAVKERIEFQKRKYANSHRRNITIVRGNALELPFQENYFDLVVCNGVLEWIGSMNKTLPPRDAQLEFLREVRRVLLPKGCLYIGIENRFGLWFLRGARDHSGLPYTSILPRSIANIIVRKYGYSGGIYSGKSKKQKEERGYYTYTYSIFGYRSLFKDAGLKTKSFWVYPSYNEPYFSGNVDDKVGLKGFVHHFKDKINRFRHILSLVEKLDKSIVGMVVSLITPSFLFYCYKDEILESYEDTMIKKIGLKNYTVLSGHHKLIYLLYDKKAFPKKVVHLQRYKYTDTSPALHDNAYQNLENLNDNKIWIDNWVPGRALNPLIYDESYMAIKWLIDFQNKTRSTIITKDDLSTEISAVRSRLFEVPRFDTLQNRRWIDAYESHVENLKLNRTAEHGDFWHGNIIYDPKLQKINVLDWEYYREKGDALYDFIFFIIHSMQLPNSGSPEDFQANLNGSGLFSPIMKKLLPIISTHLGSEPNLNIMMAYTMLRSVVRKAAERDAMRDRYLKLLNILSSNNPC